MMSYGWSVGSLQLAYLRVDIFEYVKFKIIFSFVKLELHVAEKTTEKRKEYRVFVDRKIQGKTVGKSCVHVNSIEQAKV